MLGASALLHGGTWSVEQARVLTKLDHTGIYLLIAGSYTPISLLALSGPLRVVVFSAVWLGALARIALEWFWYPPPKGWGTALYTTPGWGAGIGIPQLWTSLRVVGSLLVFFARLSF